MSVWFFIWLILSSILSYFSIWTVYILYRQKKNWADFARKHKMRYTGNRFFSSPEINGAMDGYTLGIFASEHVTADARGTRKMTAVEISLNTKMPIQGAIGSGGMVNLIQSLSYREEFQPDHKSWNPSFITRVNSRNAIEEYLTLERLEALGALFKMKNAWVIFIFEKNESLLRIDTPDPLDSPDKLQKTLQRMIKAAQILELKEGEGPRLERKSTEKRQAPKSKSIEVDDARIESASGLQLEEDEGNSPA